MNYLFSLTLYSMLILGQLQAMTKDWAIREELQLTGERQRPNEAGLPESNVLLDEEDVVVIQKQIDQRTEELLRSVKLIDELEKAIDSIQDSAGLGSVPLGTDKQPAMTNTRRENAQAVHSARSSSLLAAARQKDAHREIDTTAEANTVSPPATVPSAEEEIRIIGSENALTLSLSLKDNLEKTSNKSPLDQTLMLAGKVHAKDLSQEEAQRIALVLHDKIDPKMGRIVNEQARLEKMQQNMATFHEKLKQVHEWMANLQRKIDEIRKEAEVWGTFEKNQEKVLQAHKEMLGQFVCDATNINMLIIKLHAFQPQAISFQEAQSAALRIKKLEELREGTLTSSNQPPPQQKSYGASFFAWLGSYWWR